MKTINAAKAFQLIIARPPNGNVVVNVPQGVSNQEDDVADHWYTKVHLANGGMGSPEYAADCRAKADATFIYARDAVRQYELMEAAAAEAEAAALIETSPSYTRLALPKEEPQDAPEAVAAIEAAVDPVEPPPAPAEEPSAADVAAALAAAAAAAAADPPPAPEPEKTPEKVEQTIVAPKKGK